MDDIEKQWGTSSILRQALCIVSNPLVNSNRSYSLETLNSGQNWWFFVPCDLEIWRMPLGNNKAPLLYSVKLYASFQSHEWIQTDVRVLCDLDHWPFDLWHWPFVWTSLLSLVTIPEHFMMIRWWEHTEKGVTGRQTDRQTDIRTDGLNHS